MMKRIMVKMIALLLLLPAGEAGAMGRTPKEFPVRVEVDFGPAGKPAHQEELYVEKGTTPKEAVSQLYPVLSGRVCCSPRDVMEIGGVKIDPAANFWWVCEVNGSRNVAPSKYNLKPGDHVVWKYLGDEQ